MRLYSAEEDETIRANWKVMTSVQLQELLPNRNSHSIAGRAYRLRLDAGDRHGCGAKGGNSHRIWTINDEKRLKRMIEAGYTRTEVAKALGRTYDSVKWKMADIGVRLPQPQTLEHDKTPRYCEDHQQTHAV